MLFIGLLLLTVADVSFGGVHKLQLHKRMRQTKISRTGHSRPIFSPKVSQQNPNQLLHVTYERYAALISNITIGTPPQMFTVELDLFSPDFWIADSSCDSICSTNSDCGPHSCTSFACAFECCMMGACADRVFNASQSSSYATNEETFDLQQQRMTMTGVFASDTVRLGTEDDALALHAAQFMQVTQFDHKDKYDYDGVLGLSPIRQDTLDIEPFLSQLIDSDVLSKPIFSIFIRDAVDDMHDDGIITFGDIDTENCLAQVASAPIVSELNVQFVLSSFAMGNKYSKNARWLASIDPTSNAIRTPPAVAAAIIKAYVPNAQSDGPDAPYEIPCNSRFDDITFVIGGVQLTFTSKDLVLEYSEGYCVFALEPHPFLNEYGGSDWVIGLPFLSQFCSFVDVGAGKVSFAPVKR